MGDLSEKATGSCGLFLTSPTCSSSWLAVMVPGLSIPLDHHVRTCAPATRSEAPAVRAAPARELLAFTPTIRLHGPRWLLILLLVISRFTPAAGGPLTAALKQALLAGKDLIDDDGMTLGRGRVSMFAGPPAACDPCWVTAGKAPLPEKVTGENGIELASSNALGLLRRYSESMGGKHFNHMPADALMRVSDRPTFPSLALDRPCHRLC